MRIELEDGARMPHVLIAKYGTRVGRRSEVFLNHALYGEPDADIEMDYFFWIIRNDERSTVVDTGFSPEGGARRNRTTLATPAELLRRLAIDPVQIERVILTHAHYDHIGNLDLFPRAEFLIAARELDFWFGRHAARRQFHHSVEDAELTRLRELRSEGRLRTFSSRISLGPNIEVLEVGGHTPGQSAVIVQTIDGPVLLASDAAHYYEEIERDMPFMSAANLVDMYEGFDRITELVDSGRIAHVVAGHDPGVLQRFAPVDIGGVESLVARIG